MASKTNAAPRTNQPDKQKKNRVPEAAWKPGQSGNPNGRPPKGHSITDTIKDMMNETPEIKKALGTKVIEYALKGDMTAMKMLWQYMDGMPTQVNEITGKDGQPIQIETFTDLIRQATTRHALPDDNSPTGEPSA